jgi:DNA-binding MarR family transcriptional regulator
LAVVVAVTATNRVDPAEAAAAIHSAAIQLLRFVRKEDQAAGLSSPQLSALSVLVFAGPQTMGALAAAEQLRPPTLSRTVNELERLGLVQRVHRQADRRMVEVQATEAGRQLLNTGRARRLNRLSATLAGCSAEDLETVSAAAGIILKAIEFRRSATDQIARTS